MGPKQTKTEIGIGLQTFTDGRAGELGFYVEAPCKGRNPSSNLGLLTILNEIF
jgi:hypothetical protein